MFGTVYALYKSKSRVTTHVVRLKLFRLKAEGAGSALLRLFAEETAGSCAKHGFKICSTPFFLTA